MVANFVNFCFTNRNKLSIKKFKENVIRGVTSSKGNVSNLIQTSLISEVKLLSRLSNFKGSTIRLIENTFDRKHISANPNPNPNLTPNPLTLTLTLTLTLKQIMFSDWRNDVFFEQVYRYQS